MSEVQNAIVMLGYNYTWRTEVRDDEELRPCPGLLTLGTLAYIKVRGAEVRSSRFRRRIISPLISEERNGGNAKEGRKRTKEGRKRESLKSPSDAVLDDLDDRRGVHGYACALEAIGVVHPGQFGVCVVSSGPVSGV